MSAQELIDAEADDLVVIARAMCRAEELSGAAPCTCGDQAAMCAAISIYGDQARAVRAQLELSGRLMGRAPDAIAQDLAAYSGFRMGGPA